MGNLSGESREQNCSLLWEVLSSFLKCDLKSFFPLLSFCEALNGFNPLSPSIHIQILQTDLHAFP